MEPEERTEAPSDDPQDQPCALPQNRRCHPRYTLNEDSTLLLVSHGLSLQSHILDLSLEGCRLRTRERYTAGMRTRVEVTFKVNGIAFRFLGVVQWTDGKSLLGIRFIEMVSRRKEQLAEVICEMEAMAAAKAREEVAALREAQQQEAQLRIAVAEEEARKREQQLADELACREERENLEREARAWAEIQEIAGRTKAAHEAAALQSQAQSPARRDRRAQTRHKVDTTATILLVHGGSSLRGHILNLSESGCLIRIDERLAVGIYTRVETEFRLEGLPFRLGGVIQAVHDPHNVGIRFLDLSQRKREQVDQLIAEIAVNEELGARPASAEKSAARNQD